MKHISPASLLLVPLLTQGLLAQDYRSVPLTLGAGSFRRAIAGQFTSDLRRSVAVLRDGSVYFQFDPAFYSTFVPVPLPEATVDLVTVPRASGVTKATFLASTTAGVYEVNVEVPIGTFSHDYRLDASWNGVTGLVGAEDQSPVEWKVAGIASDGQTVLIGARDANSGQLVTRGSVSAGVTLSGVELIDWDHDNQLEVVLVAAGGLYPFELDGTPLTAVPSADTVQQTAVVTDPAVGPSLAWLTSHPATGVYEVHFANALGGHTDPLQVGLLGLSSMAITGLEAADLDGDASGDTDLVVAQRSNHKALLLRLARQEPPASSMRVVEQVARDVGDPVGNSLLDVCPPVVLDLDYSGAADIFQPRDSLPGFVVAYDPLGSLKSVTPVFSKVAYDGSDLYVEVPRALGQDAPVMEVVVWHQDNPSSLVYAVGTLYTVQLPGTGPYSLTIHMQPQGVGQGTKWEDQDHYYLDIRLRDGDAIRYAECTGLTMHTYYGQPQNGENGYLHYLNSLPSSGGDPYEIDIDDTSDQPQTGKCGGIVARKPPPPMGPGLPQIVPG